MMREGSYSLREYCNALPSVVALRRKRMPHYRTSKGVTSLPAPQRAETRRLCPMRPLSNHQGRAWRDVAGSSVPKKAHAKRLCLGQTDGPCARSVGNPAHTKGRHEETLPGCAEVASSSFRGRRSPLPRMVIWSVHARLGWLVPALLQNTQHNHVGRAPPEPPGDGPWTRPVAASQVRRGPERCRHGLASSTKSLECLCTLLQGTQQDAGRPWHVAPLVFSRGIRQCV